MRIRELSPENRPRERLERLGGSALSDAELLALVLKTGSRRENAVELCHRLLSRYPLSAFPSCSLKEFQALEGIGKAKACQLLALAELQSRIRRAKVASFPLCSPRDVFRYCSPRFSSADREHFLALFLDTKNRVLKEEVLSIGTLNSSLIHPREAFKSAIKESAHAIIFVHNHPSGDPAPSSEDEAVTQQLFAAGELLGIPVLDHVIIGKESCWSFKEGKP